MIPKNLSIITINYNQAAGLESTIQSVINQSYKNYEFIVIDGGSQDGSNEVISRYKKHISYVVSEKDKGIYDAQNKGIEQATGNYLLFLNAGDSLFDTTVLEQVCSTANNEDLIYGNVALCLNNEVTQHLTQAPKLSPQFLFFDSVCHQSIFFKSSLFKKYGHYNLNYKIAADYDFIFKLICDGISQKHVNITIANYDTGGLSANSENFKLLLKERENIQKNYLSAGEFHYLTTLRKYKNENFSKWIVKRKRMLFLADRMLKIYSRIRN